MPVHGFAELTWEPLQSGLMNTRQVIPKSDDTRRIAFQAVRINLHQFELKIVRPAKGKAASVATMLERTKALAGINGSFFFEDLSPMGLLISEGLQSNDLRKVDWGVFFVEKTKKRARLIHTRKWKNGQGVEFAIQTGPRLVVDGKPLTFRDNMARRSALCVIDDHTVVMLATENAVLMRDLAVFLSQPVAMGGMGCRHALNLDGGSSTHLVIREPGGLPGVSGFDYVPVGIGIFSR